ncbi:MAG: hypothetical protein ABJO09_09315 [Hyphomicrobiales bacterium]|uniref:hypothetical protein n=1 Tax=Pseudomonadota TaxID=1224 RepID=UPI00326591CC
MTNTIMSEELEFQGGGAHAKASRAALSPGTIVFSLILLFPVATFVVGTAIAGGLSVYGVSVRNLDAFLPYNITVGISVFLGYVGYGFSLLALVAATNIVCSLRLKEARDNFQASVLVRWYFHNALHYFVRYTFLPWILLSPAANAYYRSMGMKIGKNVTINSAIVSDPSLIELHNGVFIGGNAKLMGHYSNQEALVLSKLIIEENAAIGTGSILLGNVRVGRNSKVLPGSYVAPGTCVPPNEVWAGVPAVKIRDRTYIPML